MTLCLNSCAVPHRLDHPEPRLLHRAFLAMGTQINLTVVVREPRNERLAQSAMDSVEKSVRDFGRRWWAWGDGELGAINRALADGRAADIPEAMRPLFTRAWLLRQATLGHFEPRVGGLVRLWGFDDVEHFRSEPPSPRAIERALRDLRLAPAYDGGGRYGPARGIAWDFGAIAKGWVVDEALAQLADAGLGDAMVDAGGNLAVRGRAGARAWRVGIRDPRAPPGAARFLAELDVRDEAVNTHADDQRFFEHAGRRYGHILDPRTGAPARGLRSVTVVHRDGALADAAGAALFVAGPQHWRELARALDLEQVLVLDEAGQLLATPAMAQRIKAGAGFAGKVELY